MEDERMNIMENYTQLIVGELRKLTKSSFCYYDYSDVIKDHISNRTSKNYDEYFHPYVLKHNIEYGSTTQFMEFMVPLFGLFEKLVPDEGVQTLDLLHILISDGMYDFRDKIYHILSKRDEVIIMTDDEYLAWRMSI